jgi:hypothetical protein
MENVTRGNDVAAMNNIRAYLEILNRKFDEFEKKFDVFIDKKFDDLEIRFDKRFDTILHKFDQSLDKI